MYKWWLWSWSQCWWSRWSRRRNEKCEEKEIQKTTCCSVIVIISSSSNCSFSPLLFGDPFQFVFLLLFLFIKEIFLQPCLILFSFAIIIHADFFDFVFRLRLRRRSLLPPWSPHVLLWCDPFCMRSARSMRSKNEPCIYHDQRRCISSIGSTHWSPCKK